MLKVGIYLVIREITLLNLFLQIAPKYIACHKKMISSLRIGFKIFVIMGHIAHVKSVQV